MKRITTRVVVFLFAAVLARETVAAPRGLEGVWLGAGMDAVYTGSATAGAFTAVFPFGNTLLQAYFSFISVSPTVLLGGGANVKFTVAGSGARGVHMGGGLGLGTNGAFFINIAPLIGVHFLLVEGVMVNLDTHMAFRIATAGTNFDFGFGPQSPLLGASIVLAL